MLDYTLWPTKKVSVTSLLLDQQNPRLPQSGGALGQRQIIDELVTHDSVYELAKDITTQGFFPTEILLGVRDSDQIIIIEGNRRLAALKLLINPELAPQSYLERFRRLSEKITSTVIARVHVSIAPSRDAATPILLSRHTAQQIQSWKRPMQARFYRQLLERGLTPDDLVQSYGVTVGQIQDWVRADAVYRLACSLDFPDEVKSKVQNNREFPLSTLERLVESQSVREFLMLKPDPKEVLVSTAKPEAFLKAFRRIVQDVATGIERIAAYQERIAISNLDALTFIRRLETEFANKQLFIYLDPPYYEKGADLYMSTYGHADHVAVAKALRECKHTHWAVTYDNVPAIRRIYAAFKRIPFTLPYTAHRRRQGAELLIVPKKLVVPPKLLHAIRN